LTQLAGDRTGAIALILGLLLIPLILVVGLAVDYARIEQFKTQLQSIVDAAALAGAGAYYTNSSNADATAAATNYFNNNSTLLPGYVGTLSLNVTPAPVTIGGVSGIGVTVQSTGAIAASFLQIIEPTLAISATALAAAVPPNKDFYLLLDDSPSMAIAATPADIATMVANTPQQSGGCAFACHESNPQADNLGNPAGVDNYALARSLGVTLRIDMLQQAVQNLMTTAENIEAANGAQYRVAINTFDTGFNSIVALTPDLSLAQSQAGNINLLEVYQQEWLTPTVMNNDEDTNYDQAMTNINGVMPNPGNGLNTGGDTPQEVLFFVTDGVEDENVGGGRQTSLMNPAQCMAIKNRGIQIAVLYTTYLPLPTDSFYNTNVAPFQPQIAPDLQSCASPGLFFEVNSGGDISAAMKTLFKQALKPNPLLIQ
jgi:hypothetical protein